MNSEERSEGATLWQRKPKAAVPVDAVQYLPPGNCEQIWRLLDWGWPDKDHDEEPCTSETFLEPILDGEYRLVEPGDWIVKFGPDDYRGFSDEDFRASFEPRSS